MSGARYVSTRGRSAPVPFSVALRAGLAPDGGLYVPEPGLAIGSAWRRASGPAAIGASLAPLFDLDAAAVARAFSGAFDFPVPLVDLGDGLQVLELFHGPTAAFKDFGARAMARLLEAVIERDGGHATVLVATSGDTGGAVADAFSGLTGVRVFVLYPDGQVSREQEEQLTATRDGVTTFRVDGTFDDCQRLVKEAFADTALRPARLTSANSINVGRLVPQVVYYLWAAARLAGAGIEDAPTFVVPSGNLGNLTAGLLATEVAGLRAGFVAANNANDYLTRFLAGDVEPYGFASSVRTLSSAMDVGGPSNFERLYARYGEKLRGLVTAHMVTDEETLRRMAATARATGYVACPHTAVALEAAVRERAAGTSAPLVVLATAHPAKFAEVVAEATGELPPAHAGLARTANAEHASVPLRADGAALRSELLARAQLSA